MSCLGHDVCPSVRPGVQVAEENPDLSGYRASSEFIIGPIRAGRATQLPDAVHTHLFPEPARGRIDARDKRFHRFDTHATALAGLAVILAVIVSFLVELARGHSGNPYGWLGAIGGITYIAPIIVFRIRGEQSFTRASRSHDLSAMWTTSREWRCGRLRHATVFETNVNMSFFGPGRWRL